MKKVKDVSQKQLDKDDLFAEELEALFKKHDRIGLVTALNYDYRGEEGTAFRIEIYRILEGLKKCGMEGMLALGEAIDQATERNEDLVRKIKAIRDAIEEMGTIETTKA